MAVTHKRVDYFQGVHHKWAWIHCMAGTVPCGETAWFWKYVTCANCLKRRPKGKR